MRVGVWAWAGCYPSLSVLLTGRLALATQRLGEQQETVAVVLRAVQAPGARCCLLVAVAVLPRARVATPCGLCGRPVALVPQE